VKPPKYNKKLSFLLTPYLFYEETRKSNIPSPSLKEEASNEQTEDDAARNLQKHNIEFVYDMNLTQPIPVQHFPCLVAIYV
jgi:hypothetical protein